MGGAPSAGKAEAESANAPALAAWCIAARAQFLALAAGPQRRGRRAAPGWPGGGAGDLPVDSRCWAPGAPCPASSRYPSCSSRFACNCPSLMMVVNVDRRFRQRGPNPHGLCGESSHIFKSDSERKIYLWEKHITIHGTSWFFSFLEPSHATMSAPKCWVHSQTPHNVIFHVSGTIRSRLEYFFQGHFIEEYYLRPILLHILEERWDKGIARCRKTKWYSNSEVLYIFLGEDREQRPNTQVHQGEYLNSI